MTVAEAYAVCASIARREAKNFYYAFRVLPEHKRNAMCAVYAFMRKADDISDEESVSIAERRVIMQQWLDEWRQARGSAATADPIFVALNDTQRRFEIPDALLEELVEGTSMDLAPQPAEVSGMQTCATFDELYRYCYLVASVVGLVCIRIFGYRDPRAEKLAEETGIAFQLTNILRDIKEDAERGRVYLPLDLLREHGVTLDRIKALSGGAPIAAGERTMLVTLAAKAEQYYGSAKLLLPLIDRDSRAALWVLVRIYNELLHKITNAGGDVLSRRISVPTSQKLWILAEGAAMALSNKVMA
ncbi:MAG: phytoene/squalene synthase family protein [Acidobacteriaceae bacterium]|nr:phytoene/squalene synthase family protein [Acidobacteriaceae bacterium]